MHKKAKENTLFDTAFPLFSVKIIQRQNQHFLGQIL